MYYEYYLLGIILLPAVIFSAYAQIKIQSNYHKYNQVFSQSGITARELVERILRQAGINDIKIIAVNGDLNNYFDPRRRVIALSNTVIDSTSISALGIACHEVGHALQYQANYLPIKFRNIVIPACNFANIFLWPLVLIGLFLGLGASSYSIYGQICLYAGLAVFGLSALLNFITLPVEYNASSRAKTLLLETGALSQEELTGAKKVLDSAALTYVAAFVVAVLNLIRFLLVFADRKD